MPRVIETTWLEDAGFWHQPLFDVKVANLTPRQFLIIAFFAGLAFMLTRGLWFLGDVKQVIVGLAFFVSGCSIFVRRGKTFAPEWYFYYLASRAFRRRPKKGKRSWAKTPAAPEAPETVEILATVGLPRRITGVLYSASTGEPLPNVNVEVRADGAPYHATRTIYDGSYAFFYTPPMPGLHELEISRSMGKEAVRYRVLAGLTETGHAPELAVVRPIQPAGAPSAKKETKKEKERKERYVYELFPINFATLPPKKQVEAVERFCGTLNSLNRRIRITIARFERTVEIKGKQVPTSYHRYFAECDTPLEGVLEVGRFNYQRIPRSAFPEPKVVRAYSSWVALEGGKLAQTATVCKLPVSLPEGYFTFLYDALERMTIEINPMVPDKASRKITAFADRIEGAILENAKRGKSSTDAMQQLAGRLRDFAQRLTGGMTRLFEMKVNLTVGGKDERELKANREIVTRYTGASLMSLDWPRFVQADLIRGALGKRLLIDSFTAGVLYPFASSEVFESPGGVFLGENGITHGPVIFDPFLRPNQNVMIIGKSGVGKSMSLKIFVHRMVERYPNIAIFIVDPEGEYVRAVRGLPGVKVVRVTRREQLGLDPLVLFGDSKSNAADVLADMLNLDPDREPELASELAVLVNDCGSLPEVQKRASRKLKARLAGIIRGPEKFVVTGKPLKFSERMVFDLSELHRALQLSQKRVGALHLACLLLFTKIWDYVKRMPESQPKLVVVDELWLYLKLATSAKFIEQVARRGRKANIVLGLSTQNPTDVLNVEAGANTVKNCDTKILLCQDQTSMTRLTEELELTESEQSMLTKFRPGEAMLMGEGIRIPMGFLSTPEEYAIFTTKPGEVST
jgi:hypothetical protein